MLWFFVTLQAMAPFIHAHAGSMQRNHSGFLHGHQGANVDAFSHAVVFGEHGAEVDVAQGMPMRDHPRGLAADPSPAVAARLPRAVDASHPGSGPWASPQPPPALADFAFPYALAPPLA